MSKFDPDEIGTLMHVAERVHREHPNMAHIHRHALHRLRQIDRELASEPTDAGIPSPSTAHVAPQAPLTTGEPGRAETTGVATPPVMNPESATQPAEPPVQGEPVQQPGTPTEQPQPTAAQQEAPAPASPSLLNQPAADTQPGGAATPPAPPAPANPEPATAGEPTIPRRV